MKISIGPKPKHLQKHEWNSMKIPIGPKSKRLQKHRRNRTEILEFPLIFLQKFQHRVKEFHHRFKLNAIY